MYPRCRCRIRREFLCHLQYPLSLQQCPQLKVCLMRQLQTCLVWFSLIKSNRDFVFYIKTTILVKMGVEVIFIISADFLTADLVRSRNPLWVVLTREFGRKHVTFMRSLLIRAYCCCGGSSISLHL